MSITLKELKEDDWQAFKDIRLKALRTDPQAFGSNCEKENAYPEDMWREWLTDRKRVVFGVFDDNTIIGMTGVGIDNNDPTETKAYFWGSWLEPSYRGKGLSKLLYEKRIEWATQHPTVQTIVASYWKSNLASGKAMKSKGFTEKYTENNTRSSDGQIEEQIFCELALPPKARGQKPSLDL